MAFPLVVCIVGPTAIGKSDLGFDLAQTFGGELISADSRQIYRHLDIGTAKPTVAERLAVPHHMVDVANPDEVFSLADFQEGACKAIDGALARARLPLLVGGTGLYVKAIVEGLTIPRVAPWPDLRAALEQRAVGDGAISLHRDLEKLDPAAAARIDARNVRRVVRALEVCISAGQPVTELQAKRQPRYRFLSIGLTSDRHVLYQRIDRRVEIQFAGGLIDETKRVLEMGYQSTLPSMSGLGHRQAALYLCGTISLPEAIDMDKHDTHRFARQQYNWFRLNDERIHWLDRDELSWRKLAQKARILVEETVAC